uniref:uncharacterized protein LOC122601808 n=1 Tax=Erigeron canadensis TaxID=72917 RepID=UPI001CB952A9|nr:uncharacterized protein LOC122601808 [Erigeron canadensis]
MVKQNVSYKIGDDMSISMWYDKWCSEGPLSNFISKRILYDTIMDVNTRLSTMTNNGQWMWPEGWVERFNILQNITVFCFCKWTRRIKLFELLESRDKQQVEFSTKQAWQDMRINWPKVVWNDVIWFKQFDTRHAFILWLVIQGRLMTLDRVAKWNHNDSLQCGRCNSGSDNHEHLFFQMQIY